MLFTHLLMVALAPIPNCLNRWARYADVSGFFKSTTLKEMGKHDHAPTPQPDDGEPFEEKVARLIAQWREQQAEAQKLDAAIETNLKALWDSKQEWRTGNDSSN